MLTSSVVFILSFILPIPLWHQCVKISRLYSTPLKNSLVTYLLLLALQILIILIVLILFLLGASNTVTKIFLTVLGLFVPIWTIKKRMNVSAWRSTGSYFILITINVLFALIIRSYAFQAFSIPSNAMQPTLISGDYVLVNKIKLYSSKPHSHDIIVFKYPKDPLKDFIKRVVGVEGDKVEIKNKKLYINGKQLEEGYVIHNDSRVFPIRDNLAPVKVPANSYFVMGDNRDNSYDSRFWGCVEASSVKGKAFLIYWSWDENNRRVRWERIGGII